MASNQDLINLLRDKIARLQKARALATDETVKIKLEHDIKEAEGQLAQFTEAPPPRTPTSATFTPVPDPPAPSVPLGHSPPTKVEKAAGPPWWLITAVITIVTFLLAWWVITDAKIAALVAIVAGLWLLFRNPELIYQRLSLTAMGLVVVLNAINFSGFFDGRVGENEFRLELSEPSLIVSLGLLVFAGYMMFLHSRR